MTRKLTYWVAHSLNDASCYSLRGRTRKEVKDLLAQPNFDPKYYSKPVKVEVEFTDAFDLLQQCLGEGGLTAEAMSKYLPEVAK